MVHIKPYLGSDTLCGRNLMRSSILDEHSKCLPPCDSCRGWRIEDISCGQCKADLERIRQTIPVLYGRIKESDTHHGHQE